MDGRRRIQIMERKCGSVRPDRVQMDRITDGDID